MELREVTYQIIRQVVRSLEFNHETTTMAYGAAATTTKHYCTYGLVNWTRTEIEIEDTCELVNSLEGGF
jgi:hypothetical protein